jgi:hypothetical protein
MGLKSNSITSVGRNLLSIHHHTNRFQREAQILEVKD